MHRVKVSMCLDMLWLRMQFQAQGGAGGGAAAGGLRQLADPVRRA